MFDNSFEFLADVYKDRIEKLKVKLDFAEAELKRYRLQEDQVLTPEELKRYNTLKSYGYLGLGAEIDNLHSKLTAAEARVKFLEEEILPDWEALKGNMTALIDSIGGTDYEGVPTHKFNWLQRIRILLEKESRLDRCLKMLKRLYPGICIVGHNVHVRFMDQPCVTDCELAALIKELEEK